MNRFVKKISLLSPKTAVVKSERQRILDGFTEEQKFGIKNLAKRKTIEGALEELERARPLLNKEYYYIRFHALTRALEVAKSEKMATKRVVEIRFVQ
jgi:predicted S18 family serine protease